MEQDVQSVLSERIRKARMDAGLSQGELADLLQLSSHATISRYEKGTLGVSAEMLYRIANITHKPIAFFFDTQTIDSCGITLGYESLSDYGRQRLQQYLSELSTLYPR